MGGEIVVGGPIWGPAEAGRGGESSQNSPQYSTRIGCSPSLSELSCGARYRAVGLVGICLLIGRISCAAAPWGWSPELIPSSGSGSGE